MSVYQIAMAHPFVRSTDPRYLGACAKCMRGPRDFIHRVPDPVTVMSCQDAKCDAFEKGWFMEFAFLEEQSERGDGQREFVHWLKTSSGRRFWEWQAPLLEDAVRREVSGELNITLELATWLVSRPAGSVVFAFPPRQQCFIQHLDREVVFARGNYIHARGEDFNEDWNETAYEVNRRNGHG